MPEKKKTRLIDLVQTRGSFSVSGLVTGTVKDSFYEDKLTQSTKKPFRSVNFGVNIDKDVYKRQVYWCGASNDPFDTQCVLFAFG